MIVKLVLITRQDARKGINYLVHALKILEEKKVEVVLQIAGGGRYLEANKRLAKRMNIKSVHFLGFVSNTSDLLSTANIYVFPSVEEGSSAISLLEAMRYGLSIVATNIDGIPEDIENEISGILVPPKNPKAIADAIERLVKNKQFAKSLGRSAKKRYYERHGKAIVSRALKKLLYEK